MTQDLMGGQEGPRRSHEPGPVSPDFYLAPLPAGKRCTTQTQNGICTNIGYWQLYADGEDRWHAICYIHMHEAVKDYQELRKREEEEIARMVMSRTETQQLPSVRKKETQT